MKNINCYTVVVNCHFVCQCLHYDLPLCYRGKFQVFVSISSKSI